VWRRYFFFLVSPNSSNFIYRDEDDWEDEYNGVFGDKRQCITISGRQTIKINTLTFDIGNSTVLQDDDDLTFSVDANKTYSFTYKILVDLPKGYKYNFIAPTGATILRNTKSDYFIGNGKIITGSTAGIFQFVQNISNIKILKGSTLTVMEDDDDNSIRGWPYLNRSLSKDTIGLGTTTPVTALTVNNNGISTFKGTGVGLHLTTVYGVPYISSKKRQCINFRR